MPFNTHKINKLMIFRLPMVLKVPPSPFRYLPSFGDVYSFLQISWIPPCSWMRRIPSRPRCSMSSRSVLRVMPYCAGLPSIVAICYEYICNAKKKIVHYFESARERLHCRFKISWIQHSFWRLFCGNSPHMKVSKRERERERVVEYTNEPSWNIAWRYLAFIKL